MNDGRRISLKNLLVSVNLSELILIRALKSPKLSLMHSHKDFFSFPGTQEFIIFFKIRSALVAI